MPGPGNVGPGISAPSSGGGGGSGTVTSVSVAAANGFAGTVANATTTPAITVSTSVTGLLKGNGTSVVAATAGTDYLVSTTVLVTGTHTVAASGEIDLASAAGGSFVITTLAATLNNQFTVKKTDATANTVTITPASGLIDGLTSLVLTTYNRAVTLVADGTNWNII